MSAQHTPDPIQKPIILSDTQRTAGDVPMKARANFLADALESMTHPMSGVPVIYHHFVRDAAALLRRLADTACNVVIR